MKIVHVFKDYFPPTRGGVEHHINDVVHSLEGFEFAVLTSSRSRQKVLDNDRGVRVVRAPEYGRPASTAITPSWRRLLRKVPADLLHFHMPNPFGELCLLGARSWTPMIATYHADIVGRRGALPLFAPFQERFLKRAKSIIVSSPQLLDSSEALVKHRDRTVVIPFGVDPDAWKGPPAKTHELRERYPGTLILFLGRLVYYKGVEVLIEAMGGIDATLIVAGEGPKRLELEALAVQHRVRRKVMFVGDVPDEERSAYYHAADVFVLPATSRAETFGIAMLEAMASGTPAVSTEVGTGTSWVNQNGSTGLVVQPGEPAMLAGAIKALLADESRRKALGEASQARVREAFTKSAMLEAMAEVYSSI